MCFEVYKQKINQEPHDLEDIAIWPLSLISLQKSLWNLMVFIWKHNIVQHKGPINMKPIGMGFIGL